MLKVLETALLKEEKLELDGYTFNIRWNQLLATGHVFWRTGNFRNSLLEIGINRESHVLEEMHIVNIQKDWIALDEILNLNDPALSRDTGLPIIEWYDYSPSPMYVDEVGHFAIHLAYSHLSLLIGNDNSVVKILVAGRTLFGINASNNLVGIQVIDLDAQETSIIKSTFERRFGKIFRET